MKLAGTMDLPGRGETVRVNVRVWPVVVVFALLGFALGGCGTLSLGDFPTARSMSAADTLPEPAAIATEAVAGSADTAASAIAAPSAPSESPATVGDRSPEPAIDIVYEPITAQNAPSWVVALSGTAVIAQTGTPDVLPQDQDLEEYDPWEPFNVVMFNFNYNLDRKVLRPVAKGYNFIMPDMFQTMIDNAFTN